LEKIALACFSTVDSDMKRARPMAGLVRPSAIFPSTSSPRGLSVPNADSSFKSTNPIESMISVARTVTGNVKRWRNGEMILRWTANVVLEAEKQFRRVNG